MGKRRKRVQKNTGENRGGESSNSNSNSSSSAMCASSQGHGQNDSTENNNSNKIEGGNTTKKINRGESSNSSSQVEAETDPGQATSTEDAPIDNLPPEMLTLILKFVDTRSLVKCRLVSRQWSGISTAIFRSRLPPIPIWFLWEEGKFSQKDGRSLKEFVQCAKTSTPENCPFAYFWFSTYGSNCFDDKDFRDLLSLFSTRRLKHVHLDSTYRATQFPGLVKKLRRFLLNDVPQLEELHLKLSLDWLSSERVNYEQFPLFLSPINVDGVFIPVPVPVPPPLQFQLPNLKLLHLDPWTISPHLQIAKDLLNAAVNLIRIQMWTRSPEDLKFLHSLGLGLGKLHLLKETSIVIDVDFVEDLKDEKFQTWSFPQLQLEILNVGKNMEMDRFDQAGLNQTSRFLTNLFESSKDSLKQLEVGPLGFLPHLQLPTFTRLRKLKISRGASEDHPVFPRQTRTRNIFPAVDSLKLYVENWPLAFPHQDSVPRLPSVKTLRQKEWLFVHEITDISVFMLALICPNLKRLFIKKSKEESRPPQLNFVQVGRSIFTHMKELESLELDMDLDKLENNSLALDSCFSGVSIGNCRRLLSITEAKQLLEENGIPVEIPQSKLTAEREYLSILEMKKLRNLTVNPYLGKILLDKTEFSNKLTWISHELAFKLMPNFKLNEGDF